MKKKSQLNVKCVDIIGLAWTQTALKYRKIPHETSLKKLFNQAVLIKIDKM